MKGKRERMKPGTGGAHFVRRSARGRFTGKQVDVGRSLNRHRHQKAKTTVPSGQGDRRDQGATSRSGRRDVASCYAAGASMSGRARRSSSPSSKRSIRSRRRNALPDGASTIAVDR